MRTAESGVGCTGHRTRKDCPPGPTPRCSPTLEPIKVTVESSHVSTFMRNLSCQTICPASCGRRSRNASTTQQGTWPASRIEGDDAGEAVVRIPRERTLPRTRRPPCWRCRLGPVQPARAPHRQPPPARERCARRRRCPELEGATDARALGAAGHAHDVAPPPLRLASTGRRRSTRVPRRGCDTPSPSPPIIVMSISSRTTGRCTWVVEHRDVGVGGAVALAHSSAMPTACTRS